MKYIALVFCCIAIIACNQNMEMKEVEVEETTEISEKVIPENFDPVNLESYGLPFEMYVPNQKITHAPIEVIYNDGAGVVTIKSGKKFAMDIKEAPGDMVLLKEDLENDLMYENSIVIEKQNLIVYDSKLPDGSTTFRNFYAIIEMDGLQFVAENQKGEELSEHYINRMITAVETAKPVIKNL